MQKVIVVAGGDRSIGNEMIKLYLERGERVIAGKFLKKWPFLDELKERFPDTLEIAPIDVRSDESVKNFAEFVKSKTDKIDILINSEGVWLDDEKGSILDDDINFKDMQESYNVNALGPLRVISSLYKLVANSETKIIATLTSCNGVFSGGFKFDRSFSYFMAKAGNNAGAILMNNSLKTLGIKMFLYHAGFMLSWMAVPPESEDAPFVPLPDLRHEVTYEQSSKQLLGILDNPDKYINPNGDPAFLGFDQTLLEW